MPPRNLPFFLAFAVLAGSLQAQVALDRPSHSQPAAAPAVFLADGFDFPVGKPNAAGYYKARGFSLGTHPGEDWDGIGGGDSDLNDPVDSIADGEVVFAEDARLGWGNVIIVRHQFLENDEVKTLDAFYAHLGTMFVRQGQRVKRGEEIGTVGTAHGRYEAHLHFEIRKISPSAPTARPIRVTSAATTTRQNLSTPTGTCRWSIRPRSPRVSRET